MALLLLASSLGRSALAEQPTSGNRVSSQVRYREAIAAFRQGKWQDARHLLVELWSESRTYDVAVTLVQTEYQLEHYAAAAGYLEFALANIPPTEKLSAAEQYKKNLLELRARTSRVSIDTKPTAAELRIDAQPVGKSPLASAIYLDPGQHVIEAQLGDLRATQTVDATRGSELAVRLNLARDSAPPSVAPQAPPLPLQAPDAAKETRSSTKLLVVSAGAVVTVVALAIGAGYALHGHSRQADVDRLKAQARQELGGNCSAQSSTALCRDLIRSATDRNTANQAARVAFISSGVLAAGTLAALAFWPTSASSNHARIAPVFDERSIALAIQGTF